MGKIRIGIVGAGFGSYGLAPAFRRDGRCEVVGIATSKNWKELIARPDVDAVAIATPPLFQPDIAFAAIELGKPVFAEKPLAANFAEAHMLMRAAEDSYLANCVDFLFPELDTFAKAKQLMTDGSIGTPLHIKADWIFWSADHRDDKTTWRTDAHSGGGALAHFGSHMIYYLQWFCGPIVSITAAIKHFGQKHSGDTIATLMLAFENGTTGALTVSSGSPISPRHTIEILGRTGSLVLSNTQWNPVAFTLKHYKGQEPINELVEPLETGVDCRVPAASKIVKRFIDWILTGEKTRPSFRDGYDVQRVIQSACG